MSHVALTSKTNAVLCNTIRHVDSPLYSEPPSAYSITRHTCNRNTGHQKTRKQRQAGLHEQGWCQGGTTVTRRDVHVYLPDCDRSRTASQCWGDLLARAAGAEDKRKKYVLVYSACLL